MADSVFAFLQSIRIAAVSIQKFQRMGLHEIVGPNDQFCRRFNVICNVVESLAYKYSPQTNPEAMTFFRNRKAGGASLK